MSWLAHESSSKWQPDFLRYDASREHEVNLNRLVDAVFQIIPDEHIWPLYTKDLTIFSDQDPAPDSI
jgi:hypothetical protein